MKKLLLLASIVYSTLAFAQNPGDTIRVQTFTWDSATRSGIFNFDIDTSLSYEKVIMKYNMRCHGALVNMTGGNGIACGEWDYSCNTFVTDSSYTDSVKATSPDFTISNFSGATYYYTTDPTYTFVEYSQQDVTINSTISETVANLGSGSNTYADPLSVNLTSGKSQYVYRASELLAGGLTAGNITGLRLNIQSTGSAAEFFKIKMAHTVDTNLFESSVFEQDSVMQEVYFLEYDATSTGSQHYQFYNPFVWDGTSNIIVEFSFTNNASQTSIDVQGETTADTNVVSNNTDEYLELGGGSQYFDVADGTYNFDNGFSFTGWLKFDDLGNWSRVIDFGNGAGSDNLIIAHPGTTNDLTLNVRQGNSAMSITASGVITIGEWMHVAATISTSNEGKIYVNGQLVESGTVHLPLSINRTNNYVGRSNWSNDAYYNGGMDDIAIWGFELSQTDIKDWMYKEMDATHPNYSDLLMAYDFNNNTTDLSSNGTVGTLENNARTTLFNGEDKFKNFDEVQNRPNIDLVQGNYTETTTVVTVTDTIENFPNIVNEYGVNNNELELVNTYTYWEAGYSYVYDQDGMLVDSTYYNPDGSITIGSLNHYNYRPMKYEITSFVTPYGIGLDLGQEGKTYTMDVSEYINVLRGKKYVSMEYGGQYQEEFDIEFLYIVGTPPADVLDFRQIWRTDGPSNTQINNDDYFEPRDVPTPSNGETFVVKAAITGHGQDGEFLPRSHMLNVDGGGADFYWQVWKECAENPVYPQGGTWIYDRAGWCPGMETDIQRMDISNFVTPGQTVNIDYDIEQFSSSSSSYRTNLQFVAYGPANFSNDASVADIIKPSKKVEYERLNPMCHDPEIIIKNTGGNELTSLDIKYRVNGGDTETQSWTGSLEFMQTETVVITPPPAFWKSSVLGNAETDFEVWVENPNGTADEYSHNDKMTSTFVVPDTLPKRFVVRYKGNNAPTENALYIYDDAGNVVHSNTSWTSAYVYDTLELDPGCYRLYVSDSDDDGLSFWANNDGSGDVRIAKADQFGFLKMWDLDFGDNINWYFTIDYEQVTNIEPTVLEQGGIFVYPNPNEGEFTLEMRGFENDITVNIISTIGTVAKSININRDEQLYNLIQLNDLKSGVYFIEANDGTKQFVQQVVIK